MALPGNKNFSDYDNYVTDPNPTTSAQAQDYFRNQWELLKAVIDCDFWQPETVYQPGDVVKSDSMPNGTEAVMVATKASVTSNVEPQWGAVGGENISDGACFWKLRYKTTVTDTMADYPLRNKAYSLNAIVACPYHAGFMLKCTQAGTTSTGSLDTTSATLGKVYTDGGVKWEVINVFWEKASKEEVKAGVETDKVVTPALVKEEMLYFPAKSVRSNIVLRGPTTIADIRNALDNWLLTHLNDFSACKLELNSSWIKLWNKEDLETTINASWWYNFQTITAYSTNGYAQFLVSSYADKDVYIVAKVGGVWKPIRQIATADMLPVGTIIPYAGTSVPTGFLDCGGAGVNRNTYANLFDEIGTVWGEGDGSTTFNLPNLNNNSFLEGDNTVGVVKEAGLPNVVGTLNILHARVNAVSGAFERVDGGEALYGTEHSTKANNMTLDASRCSSVYRDDVTTVQPKSATVRYCIKY